MKYIITIAFVISCTTKGMDTDSQKELQTQKLRNIVRDGNLQLFEDNQTAFAKGLEYHDIHYAHWQCENRLAAIKELPNYVFQHAHEHLSNPHAKRNKKESLRPMHF